MATQLFKTPPARKVEAGTITWLNNCIERGKSEKFSEWTILTPGLAGELLRRNPDNRNIRAAKLSQLTSDVAAGRWAENGETIIISRDGFLNDGQHRCQAVVDANRTISVQLSFGVDRDTRYTIDQGGARSAGDYLSMEGVRNATTQATIARLVLAFEKNARRTLANSNRTTNAEVRERVATDTRIDGSAVFAQRHNARAQRFMAPSVMGFCHYVLSEIDLEDADNYLAQVAAGEGLRAKDPAYAVRERLLSAGKAGAEMKSHIIFRGWNAYRQGRKLDTAKVLDGGLPAVI